jgi:hypothetical protein
MAPTNTGPTLPLDFLLAWSKVIGFLSMIESANLSRVCQQFRQIVRGGAGNELKLEKIEKYCSITRSLEDSAFVASSSSNEKYGPHWSRLGHSSQASNRSRAWRAEFNDDQQWIEVDLQRPHLITGMVLRPSKDKDEWVAFVSAISSCYLLFVLVVACHINFAICIKVTQLSLEFSLDRKQYLSTAIIPGISHGQFVQLIDFPADSLHYIGRYVRLRPHRYHGHISVRWGLCGEVEDNATELAGAHERVQASLCYPDAVALACAFFNTIPDSCFNGSSARSLPEAVHCCRLSPNYLSDSVWSAGANNFEQWLQVDLLAVHSILAVVTQGHPFNDGVVTKFAVMISLDNSTFSCISRPDFSIEGGVDEKTFVRSSAPRFIAVHPLPEPVRARYVRIVPFAWTSHISLRWAVLRDPRFRW